MVVQRKTRAKASLTVYYLSIYRILYLLELASIMNVLVSTHFVLVIIFLYISTVAQYDYGRWRNYSKVNQT